MSETNTTAVPKIYAAINEASKLIGDVPKNGHFRAEMRNGGSIEYDYVKAEDISKAVSNACREVGIIQVPTYDLTYEERKTSTQAGFTPMAQVHLTLRLISTEDGSEVEVKAVGEGAGQDDKVARKGVTSALKIAHILAFNIPTAELDPDDGPSPVAAEEKPAGPNRGQQMTGRASTPSTPTAAPHSPSTTPVQALQKQIREASEKRSEAEGSPFNYTEFGSKKFGVPVNEWSRDEAKLKELLTAIQSGEVVE